MAIVFELTPEEAQPVAEAISRWLRQHRIEHEIEKHLADGAPYRTTFVAPRGEPPLLIEAQGKFNYHRAVADLANWLMGQRVNAELYIAVDSNAEIPAYALEEIRAKGVGLLIVKPDGRVIVSHPALNSALLVTPDPRLRFGSTSQEVIAAVDKFNKVNRKDGLRDMCEIVERETEKVALAASRKGLLKMDEKAIKGMDWSTKINTLASVNAYVLGSTPLLDEPAKNDFHSFRGARNLVDHPPRSKRDKDKRERQFTERMAQGPRLVAELVALKRKIGRI